MNARDGYDHSPDHDECDAPRGSDPLLRRDMGVLFFFHRGFWWQTQHPMPADVRKAWIEEEIRRDRAAKEATP